MSCINGPVACAKLTSHDTSVSDPFHFVTDPDQFRGNTDPDPVSDPT